MSKIRFIAYTIKGQKVEFDYHVDYVEALRSGNYFQNPPDSKKEEATKSKVEDKKEVKANIVESTGASVNDVAEEKVQPPTTSLKRRRIE